MIKALVAKYPEVRDAFYAVIARAVDASGHEYGSMLAHEGDQVAGERLNPALVVASRVSAFLTSAAALTGRSNLHSSGFLSKRSPSKTGRTHLDAAALPFVRPLGELDFGHQLRLHEVDRPRALHFAEERTAAWSPAPAAASTMPRAICSVKPLPAWPTWISRPWSS